MSPPLGSAWREAAVFGATWGALEVTLGAFLHTLRLPFAGLLLTCCGVALLVTGRQLFPRAGFGLRAALICAGLKAFSPGGVIFGPMIGIVTEGILVELMFLALRWPLPSALVGGALAATWTVAQSLLNKLLIYGVGIFELYWALLVKAAETLGQDPKAVGIPALVVFLLLVAGLGATGGALGLALGRAVAARGASAGPLVAFPTTDVSPERVVVARRMGGLALGLSLTGLALQGISKPLPSLVGLALSLGATWWLDRPAVAFLGRKRFWIISLAIGCLAGLFLGKAPSSVAGVPLSWSGLVAGALMVVRSAVFLLTAALAARHVPRARFVAWSAKLGLAPLGPALSAAVALLPALRAGWAQVPQVGRRPQVLFAAVVTLLSSVLPLAREADD